MNTEWTVLQALTWTTAFFERKGAGSPRLDAQVLLAHCLGTSRIGLYVDYDRPLTAPERQRYRALVVRRGEGVPVQYLTGRQEFWSLELAVEPGVLIPRPETERLVELALEHLRGRRLPVTPSDAPPPLRIADVGTGSGCIAIALARELEHAEVWAGDIAHVPIRVAADNAASHGVGERVRVCHADGLDGLWRAAGQQPFDLVVSNPPYLATGELAGLMREVRDHEPEIALVAGPTGLEAIVAIAQVAADPRVLRPGGALMMEISAVDQAAAAAQALETAGLVGVGVRPDHAGRPRVVVGESPTR